MSRPPAPPAAGRAASTHLPLLNVGMVLFLGSEVMFFSGLFAMYFSLRAASSRWPPHGAELDMLWPSVFTLVLVASSGTYQLAVERIARGDRPGMSRWLWATLGLGVVFLMGQAYDWSTRPFAVSSHAYGSAFYTMTGFHGLHVAGGLLLMLVLLGRSARGAYSAEDHAGVEAVGYYWHFVDVVWLALYGTIFWIR